MSQPFARPPAEGLCNAISKAKRESQPQVAAPAAPAVKYTPWTGPNADCDYFGTRRGAHKTPGVCACFVRVFTKNENDLSAMNCASCGKPATEHADLGPAPALPETEGVEFDLASVAVDGRAAFAHLGGGHGGAAAEGSVEPSAEAVAMFEAGTDPLAAAMGGAHAPFNHQDIMNDWSEGQPLLRSHLRLLGAEPRK